MGFWHKIRNVWPKVVGNRLHDGRDVDFNFYFKISSFLSFYLNCHFHAVCVTLLNIGLNVHFKP